tara:strand:- start:141 stop:374 length:234 start_codon:yes stop_codon:yes gene_type:complete
MTLLNAVNDYAFLPEVNDFRLTLEISPLGVSSVVCLTTFTLAVYHLVCTPLNKPNIFGNTIPFSGPSDERFTYFYIR